MADRLSLLFELDTDPAKSIAGFKRARVEFAREIAAMRKLVTQAFILPPIKLPTTQTARQGAQQANTGVAAQRLANQQTRVQQTAQRLVITNNQLAVASQRVANAQVQASAGAIRATTSYQRATVAASSFARSQSGISRSLQSVLASIRGIGPGLQSLGRTLSIGITAPIVALGVASLKSAKDLDANVNTLKAFTGSAQAAEVRLAQLIKTARDTPGLTTNLALTLDAYLRTARATEESINRVLPAIGRLNAVSRLQDPQRFVQNLVQLVTQDFERIDLKELVGQSPIAGQVLAELFNVDSPINAKAIRESAKKLGITTVDSFFAAFADAAQRNQGLATVTESIGTRFDKIVDRVQIALRPLGLSIINALEPFVEPVAKLVERIGEAFDALPESLKTLTIVAAGIAAATGPLLFILGSLLQSIGQIIPALVTLNAIGLLPTLTNLRLIGQVMVGTASLAAGATATAAVAAAGWIALAAALGIAAVAIFRLVTAEKELAKVSAEQIRATSGEIKSLKEQLTFVNGLRGGVASTATEQERLRRIYAALNPESRARVESIKDETKRSGELWVELQRLLALRSEEQRIQAATLSANLDQTIRQANQTETAIERATQRINDLSRAREALERSAAPLSREQIEALRFPDLFGTGRDQQIQLLQKRIESLIKLQGDLRTEADKLNGTAREQSELLKSLAEQTGLSERQILVQARALGILKTDVDSALKSIEAYRARQGEAAAATKEGTTEIDEQTKSLKALKRALKEAEIATRERSAATRRAFEEDKISSQEATRQLISDARQLAAAQIKEIDETLESKRKEAEGVDADATEKLQDEIGELELKKKQIISETATEVEDLRAQQRRREREGESEHQTTLIEIRRTSADEQIAALRDRIEREESFRLQGEQQIVVIERRVTQAEEDEIRRRLEIVAEGTEARRRLEDELAKFVADKARQRAEQARRLAQAELDAALLPTRRQRLQEGAQSAGDAGVISRLQAIADEGRASFESTERQVGKIIDQGFERRIKRLQDEIRIRQQHNQDVAEQNAELRTLEQERQNSAEETDRAIEQARQNDLDRARSYRERLASIYGGVAEIILQLRERVIDALRRGLAPERQIIDEENKLAVAREQLRHAQVAGEIQENIDRLEALQKRRTLNAQELKELKAHREALKAESDLHRSNQEEIERQRRIDLERANPDSTRSLFGDTFADAAEAIRAAAAAADIAISNLSVTLGSFGAAAAEHFANASAQAGNFISILLDGISQITAGLGDMLANWALLGETGSAAFRKLIASTLAYYAKTFLIKALDNIGEGFSNLAKAAAAAASGNFASAALYKAAAAQNFISAAKYGIASAATAVAGRFAAGDTFRQGDTASRAINGGVNAEPRNQNFNLGGQGPVESSSQAAREGSAAAMIRGLAEEVKRTRQDTALLTAKLDSTLSRINSMPAGQVVTMGAADARQAIGVAVIDHSNSSGDFNEALQRNLGFA